MTRIGTVVRCCAPIAALLVAGGAAAADRMPKLPGDHVFARSEGSPGPVTFSHASHVDTAKPSCVSCHPQKFRILERGRIATGDAIKHEDMEKGAGCGSCHGKSAFGFDSCDTCHKQ